MNWGWNNLSNIFIHWEAFCHEQWTPLLISVHPPAALAILFFNNHSWQSFKFCQIRVWSEEDWRRICCLHGFCLNKLNRCINPVCFNSIQCFVTKQNIQRNSCVSLKHLTIGHRKTKSSTFLLPWWSIYPRLFNSIDLNPGIELQTILLQDNQANWSEILLQ